MSLSLGELVAYIGADTKDFDRGMDRSMNKMQSAGKKMKQVGKSMTMYVSAPLIAAGTASFKMAKDFEASMSKITGLVGVAAEQVDAWSKDIIKMAPEIGKSPKELADALFFVTSAGIKGAAAMEVLEMSAKASAAGLGETQVVADLVTSAMNAYGAENLNAAAATDILISAVREGKAAAPELAGALGQVLPIASEMGVSFDQVGAAVAAMTRTGTNAATASMQLKNILASMLKPTSQAADQMEMMGTSAADMRKRIREDGLIAALGDLKKMTNEYGEEAMARVFPNIRALMGVLDLMGANAEDNIAIFDSLSDSTGALDKAFATTSQTAEQKYQKAMASLKTSSVQFGNVVKEAFIPILQQLGDWLQRAGNWFEGLSDRGKKITLIVGGIATAMGPLLTTMGFMVGNVMPGMIKGIVGIGKAFGVLSKLLLANPWAAAIAGIALLTVGIVKLIKKQRESNVQVDEFTKKLGEEQFALTDTFEALKMTKEGTDERKEAIKRVNEKYGEYLPNLLTEKSTLEEIEAAQKMANKAMIQKVAIMQRDSEIQAQQKKLIEESGDMTKELNKELQKFVGPEVAGQMIRRYNEINRETGNAFEAMKIWKEEFKDTKGIGQVTMRLASDFASLNDTQQDVAQTIEDINLFYDGYITKTEKAKDAVVEETTAVVEQTKETVKATSVIEESTNAYEALTTRLKEVNEAIQAAAASGSPIPDELIAEARQAQEELRLVNNAIAQAQLMANYTGPSKMSAKSAGKTKQEGVGVGFTPDFGEGPERVQEMAIGIDTTQAEEDMTNFAMKLDGMWEGVSEDIGRAFADMVGVATDALGQMIATGEADWNSLVGTALDSIDQIVKGLFAQAIAAMIAGESTKGLVGLATAAVGIAAIKALWSNKVQGQTEGLYTGGEVTQGGMFDVGEYGRERVYLPAGSAVKSSSKLRDAEKSGKLEGQIRMGRGEMVVFIREALAYDRRFGNSLNMG